MVNDALSLGWSKARPAADATDVSFASRVSTGTEPTGDGVIDVGTGGMQGFPGVALAAYATASDNDTFAMRLIGWRVVGSQANTKLWVPVPIADFNLTCSAAVGVAGRLVTSSQRFADTISDPGVNGVSVRSPGSDLVGHVLADTRGFQKLEVLFAITSGPTAMNALWSPVSYVPEANVTATLLAGANVIGQVYSFGAKVSAAYTRPSDTTSYAALDAVSDSTSAPTVLTFTSIARAAAARGTIVKATLATSQTTCTARLRLHLFNAAPTAINDNAGCTAPLAAALSSYVGYIDFPALQTGGGSPDLAFAVNADARLEFLTNASANLFGLLETLDVFTPASGQTFTVALSSVE